MREEMVNINRAGAQAQIAAAQSTIQANQAVETYFQQKQAQAAEEHAQYMRTMQQIERTEAAKETQAQVQTAYYTEMLQNLRRGSGTENDSN